MLDPLRRQRQQCKGDDCGIDADVRSANLESWTNRTMTDPGAQREPGIQRDVRSWPQLYHSPPTVPPAIYRVAPLAPQIIVVVHVTHSRSPCTQQREPLQCTPVACVRHLPQQLRPFSLSGRAATTAPLTPQDPHHPSRRRGDVPVARTPLSHRHPMAPHGAPPQDQTLL